VIRHRDDPASKNAPMQTQGFSQTAVTPLLRRWWLVVVLGVAISVVGILLLANLASAAFTLALLIGLGLLLTGIEEIVEADRHQKRWPSYVLGAIWIVTAIWAVAWPGVTLWALAVVIGIGLIAGGIVGIAFAISYRRELPFWGVWLLDGLVSIAFGVMALAWPRATIIVLAILLGIRVLFRGLSTISFGLSLRTLARTTGAVNS